MTNHLSNAEFFSRLTTLFDPLRQKAHGSVYLTQKRLSRALSSSSSPPNLTDTAALPTGRSALPTASAALSTPPETPDTETFLDLHPPQPLPVLIRATNGKSKKHREAGEKVKISTIVQPDKLDAFYARYAEVCRAGMSGLKKRDKKRKRVKEKARKKKGAETEKKS